MPFDPLLILLFGLLVVMIFTWRNSRKRKADAEQMQNKLVPGAEIMTQHGIFGTLISIDDEKNEAIVETTPGTQLRVHRQTIARVVDPDRARARRRRRRARRRARGPTPWTTRPSRRLSPSSASAPRSPSAPSPPRPQSRPWPHDPRRSARPGAHSPGWASSSPCSLGLQTAGAIFWGWGWAPKLAPRPRGRHADHPDADSSKTARRSPSEQLQQSVEIIRNRIDAAGVSESEITTAGRRQHRHLHPGRARPGRPSTASSSRRSSSSAPVILDRRADAARRAATSTADRPTPASPTPTETPIRGDSDADRDAHGRPATSTGSRPKLQAEYDEFTCDQVDTSERERRARRRTAHHLRRHRQHQVHARPGRGRRAQTIADALAAAAYRTATASRTGEWGVSRSSSTRGAREVRRGDNPSVRSRASRAEPVRRSCSTAGSSPRRPRSAVITDGTPRDHRERSPRRPRRSLADQLKFGALPSSRSRGRDDHLGHSRWQPAQQRASLAGLIGLILVVIYSFVPVPRWPGRRSPRSSSPRCITYLGDHVIMSGGGLPPVAGRRGGRLIVAIGLTVRLVHRCTSNESETSCVTAAVWSARSRPGWKRALRTILRREERQPALGDHPLHPRGRHRCEASPSPSASRSIIDVIIVMLFTHPMLQLLATTRFFSSGHPLSGLDPNGTRCGLPRPRRVPGLGRTHGAAGAEP